MQDNRCRTCHSEEGFVPSTFGADRHRDLRLPLEGAHETLSCRRCHDTNLAFLSLAPSEDLYGPANFSFSLSRTQCVDCHADIHGGTLQSGADCARCHGNDSFRPSLVNNATHLPPLQGAHKAVPCFECHQGLIHEVVTATLHPLSEGGPRIPFAEKDRACRDCHDTPHGEQLPLDCARCHGEARFSPAERFDHETQSRFPLKGAHERVPCADCHRRDGENRVVYKPIDPACSSCHRDAKGNGR